MSEASLADIADAVARWGAGPCRIAPLRPGQGARRPRASFRVDLADGSIVKARRLESEAAAERQAALRAGLPASFAPILARFGPILVEAWVDGMPLRDDPGAEGPIRRAGALLAQLHAMPHAGGRTLPFRATVDGLGDDTIAGLQGLAVAGILDAPSADRLAAIVRDNAPGEVPHCLIHTDFCGENIVAAPDGRLHVIDNEHFRFGPAAMDLARSRYRWGWSMRVEGEAWSWFRAGYEAAGGEDADRRHQPFWRVAAVVASARIRQQAGDPGLEEPVAVLRDMAAGFGLDEEARA